MKAVRLEAVGKLFTREIDKPSPQAGEVLVKVEACGICGTDRHLFHGEFPCTPPVTLGHEFSGIIEAVGQGVDATLIGTRVTGDPNIACGRCASCRDGRVNLCTKLQAIGIHLDGGFAEYVVMPLNQAFQLPLGLNPLHGAFCEPLACCLHGIDVAGIRAGASVVVLGGGVIGLLCVQLARLAGATDVVLSTRQASRRALADELGATATIDPTASDPVEQLFGILPNGADVVLECAGVPDTVVQSIKMARRGGVAVIVGVMPQGQKVEIEPFDLLFREVRLLSSFLNPFTHGRAADLIASSKIEVGKLITRTVSLDEAPSVISAPPAPGEVKTLIVPR